MDDHRPTTPRRGRYRRRQRRLRAVNAPASQIAGRATPNAATALDGGLPAHSPLPLDDGLSSPSVIVQETMISSEEDGIRRGPYERSYSISRGYEAS